MKLSFDVNLDRSFFDKVEKLRKVRIEMLDTVREENLKQQEEIFQALSDAVCKREIL